MLSIPSTPPIQRMAAIDRPSAGTMNHRRRGRRIGVLSFDFELRIDRVAVILSQDESKPSSIQDWSRPPTGSVAAASVRPALSRCAIREHAGLRRGSPGARGLVADRPVEDGESLTPDADAGAPR
jgi:hypothetical protein